MLTRDGEIRTSDDLCLDAWGTKMPADVFLQKCHGNKGNQQWEYKAGVFRYSNFDIVLRLYSRISQLQTTPRMLYLAPVLIGC